MSISQGSGWPTMASLITKHFHNTKPFIYKGPNLFTPLWETCWPVTLHTQDGRAQKSRVTEEIPHHAPDSCRNGSTPLESVGLPRNGTGMDKN